VPNYGTWRCWRSDSIFAYKDERNEVVNIAAIIMFCIWVGFVVLGMLGYVFKTLEDYRIEDIEFDEMDRDNIQ